MGIICKGLYKMPREAAVKVGSEEGRFSKFKSWFFKGRIKKRVDEMGRITELSKEYDDGKILVIGAKNG